MANEESKYRVNVGQLIPAFKIKDHEGFEVTEDDLIGSTLVLYFYPKDETPGCTKEACSFRDSNKEFRKYDAIVIGISPDSADSHKKFIEGHQLNFPLLCDETLEAAKSFDVVREGNKIERTTFVIDQDGYIRWVERPVNVEGHTERVMSAVKEYSSVDESFKKALEKNEEIERKVKETLKKPKPLPPSGK